MSGSSAPAMMARCPVSPGAVLAGQPTIGECIMGKISTNFHPPYRRQIQQIAATLSEGVILIDVDQTIKWANAAALAMHGVDRPEALGRTIDEYHANFQVRFRSSQTSAAQQSIESVAAGEAFRDVIIE